MNNPEHFASTSTIWCYGPKTANGYVFGREYYNDDAYCLPNQADRSSGRSLHRIWWRFNGNRRNIWNCELNTCLFMADIYINYRFRDDTTSAKQFHVINVRWWYPVCVEILWNRITETLFIQNMCWSSNLRNWKRSSKIICVLQVLVMLDN